MAHETYNPIGFRDNTTPDINAENLNKMDNELVYLDGAMTDANNALADLETVSFDAMERIKGIPSADGGWQLINSSAYLHVVIPVKGGEKLHFVSNASQYCYLSVLSNYFGTSTNPVYCSAAPFDERITILTNRTYDYDLPNDARYLVFVVLHNNVSSVPQDFKVGGYNLTKSARDNIGALDLGLESLNGVKTIYVNGESGSDTNDGSSAAKAFKTIQKAIDSIGPVNKSTPASPVNSCQAILSVASGTYARFLVENKSILINSDGALTISTSAGIAVVAKYGANVVFNCPVSITESGNYNAISLMANACIRFLNTLSINNTGTATTIMCVADSLLFVNGTLTVSTNSTAQCIYAQYHGRVQINGANSAIDCKGIALYAQNGGEINISSTAFTISSNATTGLYAAGGTIVYRSITNNAATERNAGYGGRIYSDTQSEVDSKGVIPTNTDLNTITKPGMYRLNGTYTNAPDYSDTYYGSTTINALLFVINPNASGSSGYTVQILISGGPLAIYQRLYSGSTWQRWNSHASNTYSYLKSVDLNDVKDDGLYILNPASYTYDNYPFGGDIKSAMFVLRGMTDSHAVVQILYPIGHSIMPLYRPNVNASDTWVPFGVNENTALFVNKYSHGTYNSIAHNPRESVKLKVGTINIGHFNYGNGSYYGFRTAEYDKKLHNWRKYFCKNQFDVMNFNEWVPYIDYLASGSWDQGTKLTTEYVLKPQFNYFDSTMENDHKAAVVSSKYPLSNEMEYSLAGTVNNGSCKYYNVTIDENHVVGVYGVQLVFLANGSYNTEEAIANRAKQLESLGEVIAAHEDDYIVVMGDFNTGTDDDLANVLSFCEDNNLVPGNGGFLDWYRTHEGFNVPMSLDNILVSENILINDFEVHNNWYESLSTDHYGISADITLT